MIISFILIKLEKRIPQVNLWDLQTVDKEICLQSFLYNITFLLIDDVWLIIVLLIQKVNII